jgi:hypothetical protein
MSNMSCIGILADDADSFSRTMARLHRDSVFTEARSAMWTDGSGASLAFHGDDGMACVTPFFAAPAPSVWTVRSREPIVDGECFHCSGVDVDVLDGSGETITRTCVQLVEFQPYETFLRGPRDWRLEVVAFAHRLSCFADEAALGRAEELGSLKLAANGFLPVGMFETGDGVSGRARAMFAGRVVAVGGRRNAATGGDFVHLVVETYPGRIDVVAPADGAPPVAGEIALVMAWLVGRPVEPPLPVEKKRKRWLGLV